MAVTATTPIELVNAVYAKLPDRVTKLVNAHLK